MAWTFEVNREDSADAAAVPIVISTDATLRDGDTLLAVERLSITANNVTYAQVGERLGYWRFFPLADPLRGVVPAWGFARVVRTTRDDIPVGQRIYGFLPMATHLVARLVPAGGALVDRAPHRVPMAAVYNRYALATEEADHDDHRALLQPLLVTSFLIDSHLGDMAMFGATRVVLSSASSKTALGLAWMLKRRQGVEVVGLSSPANIAAIVDTGCYDRLMPYAEAEALGADGAMAVYVDFAGDARLTYRLHAALGDDLLASIRVGSTHREAPADAAPPPGVTPSFFFAPDHAHKRIMTWGEGGFHKRFAAALDAFIAANPWLVIDHLHGAEGIAAAWEAVLTGRADPTHGLIVRI